MTAGSMPATPNMSAETPVTPMPVHASLVRPQRFLGVERVVLGLEATLCVAVLSSGGLTIASLVVVALIVFTVHPTMVWVTAKDPQATEVYVRSRRYADYYAPHAAPWAPASTPRASVPTTR